MSGRRARKRAQKSIASARPWRRFMRLRTIIARLQGQVQMRHEALVARDHVEEFGIRLDAVDR
jgi:hypothetical protein